MHITKLINIINGQRKKQYTALYGEMTLEWNSTSDVSFRINALLGNELKINWDDDSLTDEELFETTGSIQTLSHSYSDSRERSVTIKGSGIYVMTALYVNDRNDFKSFPITAEKCTRMPNLQLVNFSGCANYKWLETPDWTLVPKLNNFNMQNCYAMRDFPFEGTGTRPANLEIINFYRSGLSSLVITDYNKLKSINLYDNDNGPLYMANLSGCSNLNDFNINGCDNLSSFNLANCSSLISGEFYNLYRTKEINLENCSKMSTARFKDLGYYLPDDEFKYSTIKWENNVSLSGVYFRGCYHTSESFPSEDAAPGLISAYLEYPYAMSGDINISQYTNLSTFFMRYATKVKNLICQGNRKIYNIECRENYGMERMNIQNCPSLYGVYGYQDSDNNKLEYFTIKNCASLYEANFDNTRLDYGFEITQCPKLERLYLNHTRLVNATIEDLPKLYEFNMSGNGNNSYLTKIHVNNCPNLYRIYARENNYSLSEVKVENCPRSDLNIDLSYNYALTNLQLSGLGMDQRRMNDVLNYVYNYSANNAGYITFANNINNYVPSESNITQLTAKGWTIDI